MTEGVAVHVTTTPFAVGDLTGLKAWEDRTLPGPILTAPTSRPEGGRAAGNPDTDPTQREIPGG